MKVRGQLVDVFEGSVYPAEIEYNRRIIGVRRLRDAPGHFILPGLADAHIHVESSMLIPSEFGRIAARHGTVALVADPHEIANVLGLRGVEFMMKNARRSPLRFFFGAPSCVPATRFETSGARLGPREVGRLLRKKDVPHLAEVMDYPGVIARGNDVMKKISLAKRYGKRIDGHAPGLGGNGLDAYLSAGIETDHECYMLAEAQEKMRKGMRILVREGSAAKNLRTLYPVLKTGKNMLCSDDTHPDDLVEGHMDRILAKCVALGVDPVSAVRCCSRNVAEHYHIPLGLLRVGDPADFVVVNDLRSFNVLETRVGGRRVFPDGHKHVVEKPLNNFHALPISPADIAAPAGAGGWPIIGAVDGEIVTGMLRPHEGPLPDITRGINKIVVINRYRNAKPAIAFVKGFGLRKGALGSSVMHDSHNIGVVGADDKTICAAANRIIGMRGGLAASDGARMRSLALPFAGLMSGERGEIVARRYKELNAAAKALGCPLKAPFMTLSFMGLLVIPHLKISDRGLFDSDRFAFV